ncbi:hypothetical protein NC652_011290 [Populus alba x Populus x berolinensis]|nr:hypothetical protein NC652_011290 [Populus alba x Populus x berolinensis]
MASPYRVHHCQNQSHCFTQPLHPPPSPAPQVSIDPHLQSLFLSSNSSSNTTNPVSSLLVLTRETTPKKKITKEQTFSLKSYIFKKKMTPIKPIFFSLLFFNESTLSSPPFTIFLLLGIILVITILHVLSETQLHVLFEPIFVPFLFTDQP